MSLWFRSPRLASYESVVWEAPANRQQAGWRAVGGKLTLTTGRLIFMANRFDAVLRGRDWSVPTEKIENLGVAERTASGGPLSGGMRRRLQVRLVGGDKELFVVKNAEWATGELSQLLADMHTSSRA